MRLDVKAAVMDSADKADCYYCTRVQRSKGKNGNAVNDVAICEIVP